jgi:hypothetical protein
MLSVITVRPNHRQHVYLLCGTHRVWRSEAEAAQHWLCTRVCVVRVCGTCIDGPVVAKHERLWAWSKSRSESDMSQSDRSATRTLWFKLPSLYQRTSGVAAGASERACGTARLTATGSRRPGSSRGGPVAGVPSEWVHIGGGPQRAQARGDATDLTA